MNPKSISLISTFANILLSVAKLVSGFAFGSIALIASGIDSSLDIISSMVTYFGIKISEKPADKEHQYGHAKYESLASYTVVLLIFASTLWIMYEAVVDLFKPGSPVQYSIVSLIIIITAIIVTEILARLKYHFGNKFGSLSLVADGQHSRSDVLSQIAVLAGLFVSKYYAPADNILAILISIYVIWSTYHLAKESVDALTDKSNTELENKIKIWLDKNGYKISDIKTRIIGKSNFAEIFLIIEQRLKTEEITSYLKEIESRLLNNFRELTQITLSIDSENISESSARNWFGGRMNYRFTNRNKTELKINRPKKEGSKIILIPYTDNDMASDFGSEQYLLIEKSKDGNITRKEIIKNPYYGAGEKSGHGVRFVRSVGANVVITKSIGSGAKKNLESQNISVMIVDSNETLKSLKDKKYDS